MAKVLVLEDNLYQGEYLKKIIEDNQYEVIMVQNISDALKVVENNDIEIFFLDIDLPDGDGMSFAKTLREVTQYEFTWIVFLTKHDNYIFDAVRKVNCHDYIMKPYEKEDIIKILSKCERNKKYIVNEKVSFKSGKLIFRLNPEKIIMIEVVNKNSYIYTENNNYEIRRVTLRAISDKLSKYNYFVRCHRSYIVNLNYIRAIKKEYSWLTIVMDYTNKKVPIGEKYKNDLISKLEK